MWGANTFSEAIEKQQQQVRKWCGNKENLLENITIELQVDITQEK